MQPPELESVGIIGAGRIGQAMARIASRAGRPVVIAHREAPQSLASMVQQLGAGVSAGTVKEAAGADMVVLAVMWPDVPQAVAGLEWEGRILIDPTNDFDPSDLNGRTSSEVVADLVAPARVVKTANIFAADLLASDPRQAGGQRVMFLSGDLILSVTTCTIPGFLFLLGDWAKVPTWAVLASIVATAVVLVPVARRVLAEPEVRSPTSEVGVAVPS